MIILSLYDYFLNKLHVYYYFFVYTCIHFLLNIEIKLFVFIRVIGLLFLKLSPIFRGWSWIFELALRRGTYCVETVYMQFFFFEFSHVAFTPQVSNVLDRCAINNAPAEARICFTQETVSIRYYILSFLDIQIRKCVFCFNTVMFISL